MTIYGGERPKGEVYQCPACAKMIRVDDADHKHDVTSWTLAAFNLQQQLAEVQNELEVKSGVLEFLKESFALALQKPLKGDAP